MAKAVGKRRAASTPEAREQQLIALAVDLVEKQLIEGTASSQVISHFLKLGSIRAQIEKELLEKKRDLAAAKAESIKSGARMEELYLNAVNAMKSYSGQEEEPDEEY
ncbi:hypothetical protein [uncultured Parasutterella sp.]|uniref:hypothetical protein n=1 Tax=uncultured Parasutterella sp. TaxID=1263098 RepID=UPI0025B699E9|nr:hypothetical protein [uncultured Parasutterella sp.]